MPHNNCCLSFDERQCIHFRGVNTEFPPRFTCSAFPDGIPKRITYGDDLHNEVAADQIGFDIFEQDEED